MGQFILYAEQQTNGQADAATAAAIQGALQAILGLQDNQCGITVGGSWVGAPRITRQASFALTGNDRFTRFAALFQYPDGSATDADVQHCIKTIADFQLVTIGAGWQPSQILPYSPTVNGTVDWWSSGQAAATHTMNNFDLSQQVGGTSTVENPTGPQLATPAANFNPGTPLGLKPEDTASIVTFLTTAMYVAAGGVALYFLWPVLMGARNVATATIERPTNRLARRSSIPGSRTAMEPARNNPGGQRRFGFGRYRKNPIVRSIVG